MKLNQPNQIRRLANMRLLNQAAVAPLLIGGMILAMVPQTIVQAKPTPDPFLVAGGGFEQLPSPPPRLQQNDYQLAQRRRRSTRNTRTWRRDYERRFDRRFDAQSYVVYIPRYSDQLLEQVQDVAANANPMSYGKRRVIQVGVYGNRQTAENWKTRLSRRGFDAQIGTIRTLQNKPQFFVIVENDSLLPMVQRVERDARIGYDNRGNPFILAGEFNDLRNAQRLVYQLQSMGILAQVRSYVSTWDTGEFPDRDFYAVSDSNLTPSQLVANNRARDTVPVIDNRSNYSVQVPNNRSNYSVQVAANRVNSSDSSTDNYYGIMIPCSQDELPSLQAQVRRMAPGLGIERGIYQIENANEPFLMLGPFMDQETARRWQRYLQDFGMINAQVFDGR